MDMVVGGTEPESRAVTDSLCPSLLLVVSFATVFTVVIIVGDSVRSSSMIKDLNRSLTLQEWSGNINRSSDNVGSIGFTENPGYSMETVSVKRYDIQIDVSGYSFVSPGPI